MVAEVAAVEEVAVVGVAVVVEEVAVAPEDPVDQDRFRPRDLDQDQDQDPKDRHGSSPGGPAPPRNHRARRPPATAPLLPEAPELVSDVVCFSW